MRAGATYYLSFDCGTKKFAYALLRINSDPPAAWGLSPAAAALAARRGAPDPAAVAELDAASREAFLLIGGGGAALCPGRKGAELSTVERVRAVQAFLRGPVRATLAAAAPDGCPPPDSPELQVAIEYQAGFNAAARTVATTLAAEYSAATVFFVGPALKNRVRLAGLPGLDRAAFQEDRASAYAANKAHAKACYWSGFAPLFGHPDLGIEPRFRGDFADCVLQVLGFLQFGDRASPEKHF